MYTVKPISSIECDFKQLGHVSVTHFRQPSTEQTGGVEKVLVFYILVAICEGKYIERLSNKDNLGVLLMEFLEHYRQNFNYDRLVISDSKVKANIFINIY